MARETNFAGIAVVTEHIRWAGDEVARITREGFVDYITATVDSSMGPQCESPLEAIFWIWWKAFTDVSRAEKYLRLCPQLEVQVEGKKFRLDFGIDLQPNQEMTSDLAAAGLKWRAIAVELDGHAFHEKTLEQVTYRNQRDRLLQQEGWTVFHFSWSELTTDPANKVWEVVSAARQQYWGLLRDISSWKQHQATLGQPDKTTEA